MKCRKYDCFLHFAVLNFICTFYNKKFGRLKITITKKCRNCLYIGDVCCNWCIIWQKLKDKTVEKPVDTVYNLA